MVTGVNDDEHVCLVVFEGTYTYVDVPPNNSSSDNFIKSDTFVIPFTFNDVKRIWEYIPLDYKRDIQDGWERKIPTETQCFLYENFHK